MANKPTISTTSSFIKSSASTSTSVILHSTYGAKSQDGIDVGVVFLDLLSEPHSLIIFLGVDVFRPSAFKVVHSLAHVLGSQSIDLFSKIGHP